MRSYRPEYKLVLAQVSTLEAKLWQTRSLLLQVMPPKISDILSSYYLANSQKERDSWELDVVCKIEDLVEGQLRDQPQGFIHQNRVLCPMCESGHEVVERGSFTFPEGFRRHLNGWGNVRQCPVIKIALDQAMDYWQSGLGQKSLREAELAIEEYTKNRRKNELLFRVHPDKPGRFLDEDLHLETPRNAEQLSFAEDRLVKLGFTIVRENNTVAYIFETDECTVYADPRSLRRISFHVFKKNEGRRGRSFSVFTFHDSLKQDLPGKFQARVRNAL